MVRKIIIVTIMVMFIAAHSVAKAKQKNFTVEELFGSYRAISLAKIEYCSSNTTIEKAKEKIGKKVVLSRERFSNFWRELLTPRYMITQHTPAKEEGEVYPRYLQLLFEVNGIYEDQVTLLTVAYPPENLPYKDFKPISYNPSDYPFEYLEIVDTDTLLIDSGCWAYTLKRIK
jgi:hypothetical protein